MPVVFLLLLLWLVFSLLSYWMRIRWHGPIGWFWIHLYCPALFGGFLSWYGWRRAAWWQYVMLGLPTSTCIAIAVLNLFDAYTVRAWTDVVAGVILWDVVLGTFFFSTAALFLSYLPPLLGWVRTQGMSRNKDVNIAPINGIFLLASGVIAAIIGIFSVSFTGSL